MGTIRYKNFKIHIIPGGHGGLPNMEFYNVMRDPEEKFGAIYQGLLAVTPIQNALRQHMKMMQKYSHRVSEVTSKGAEVMVHD